MQVLIGHSVHSCYSIKISNDPVSTLIDSPCALNFVNSICNQVLKALLQNRHTTFCQSSVWSLNFLSAASCANNTEFMTSSFLTPLIVSVNDTIVPLFTKFWLLLTAYFLAGKSCCISWMHPTSRA